MDLPSKIFYLVASLPSQDKTCLAFSRCFLDINMHDVHGCVAAIVLLNVKLYICRSARRKIKSPQFICWLSSALGVFSLAEFVVLKTVERPVI